MKRLQNEKELEWFCDLLADEGVGSFLEVGSKWGGSLEVIAKALPPDARIVSVDLPSGKRESEPVLRSVVSNLRKEGYDAHLLIGDSTDPKIIETIRLLSPFDACFIDANHTEPFVRADWANYGPMCRMVAFHDIGFKERESRAGRLPIDVPKVWSEIKGLGLRYQEKMLDQQDNGIGVIWR